MKYYNTEPAPYIAFTNMQGYRTTKKKLNIDITAVPADGRILQALLQGIEH